jgi:hypothetical protein
MPRTQQELDTALDRQHTFAVEISPKAPLPQNRQVYDPIRQLPANGFPFTTRELLHAIGSKTAALPVNQYDDCLRASLLYTYILDLDAPKNNLSGVLDGGSGSSNAPVDNLSNLLK